MALANQLQKSTMTAPSRHIYLVNHCKTKFFNYNGPRTILSFGCSSGHEITDLLQIFPHVEKVVGVEIDVTKRQEAKHHFKNDKRVRILSSSHELDNKFDLITCFNVLCNFVSNHHQTEPIDFSLFRECIQELVACLNPHGVLCIYGANYSVHSLNLGPHIQCIAIKIDSGPVPMYTHDRKLLPRGRNHIYVLINNELTTPTCEEKKQDHPVVVKSIHVDFKPVIFGLLRPGQTSSNLGDYMQTLAQVNVLSVFYNAANWDCSPGIRRVLEHFASTKPSGQSTRNKNAPTNHVQVVWVDRDNSVEQFAETQEPIYLIANGWYMHQHHDHNAFAFPFHKCIHPIFVSMHIAHPELLDTSNIVSYLQKYAPIGCRDLTTVKLMQSKNIPAYFSSCLTTTLECAAAVAETTDETLFIDTLHANATHNIAGFIAGHSADDVLELAYSQLMRYCQATSIHSTRIHCLLPTRAVSDSVSLHFCSKSGGQEGAWMHRSRFEGLTEYMMNPEMREMHALVLFENLVDRIHNLLFGMKTEQCVTETLDISHQQTLAMQPRDVRLRHPAILRCNLGGHSLQASLSAIATTTIELLAVVPVPHRLSVRDFILRKSPFAAFDGTMDIFVTFDAAYIEIFPVFLKHLATSNATILLRIWCATRQIETLSFLATYPANVVLFHIPLDKQVQFQEYTSPLHHVSNVCLDRILVEKIDFGHFNVNRIIYIDLDIAVIGSLIPLLHLDSGTKGLIAKTSIVPNVINSWISRYELHDKLNYTHGKSFNAGVLVMDVDKLRREKMCDFCCELYAKYHINDQILLNFYCGGQYKELPGQFNIFVGQDHTSYSLLPNLESSAVVLHFVGSQKPWLFATSEQYVYGKELFKTWHRFNKKPQIHIPG